MNLYRYNTRLAAYYGARADALILAGNNAEKMKKFVEIFSPEHLNYGKPQKMPIEQISELIKSLNVGMLGQELKQLPKKNEKPKDRKEQDG